MMKWKSWCLALLVLSSIPAMGQTYRWALPLGDTSSLSLAHGIAGDRSGSVVVSGIYRGTHDFDPGLGTLYEAATGLGDAFVWKFDANRQLQWYRTLRDGDHAQEFSDMAVGPSGEILLAGMAWDSIDIDPNSGQTIVIPDSGDGAYMLMLEADGSTRWAGALNSSYTVEIKDVAFDSSGNVLVMGKMRDTLDAQPGPGTFFLVNPLPKQQHFLLKLDPNMQVIWAKLVTHDIELQTIAVGKGDRICLGGIGGGGLDLDWGSGSSLLPGNPQDLTTFFVEVDSAGDQARSFFFTGTDVSGPYGMRYGRDGSLTMGLTHVGTMDVDPGPGQVLVVHGPNRGLDMLQLDSLGNFVWGWGLKQFMYNYPSSRWDLADGAIHIAGRVDDQIDVDPSADTVWLQATGYTDMVLLRYDMNGHFLSAHQFANSSMDGRSEAEVLEVDSWGRIHVAGMGKGTIDMDPGLGYVPLQSTNHSGFIAEFDTVVVVGLDPVTTNEAGLEARPNPNQGRFELRFSAPFTGLLRVCDMNGTTLISTALKGVESWECDVNLATGTYMVDVTGKSLRCVRRVVVGR